MGRGVKDELARRNERARPREAQRSIVVPTDRGEVHHEAEFVIGLRLPDGHRIGDALTESRAAEAIVAYTVGLDLTLRDRQSAAKKAGEPWAASKGFPGSAPLAALRRARLEAAFGSWQLQLDVNGESRQRAPLSDMTLSPAAIVAHLSRRFPLADGDLVFTGTPAGVGSLASGDRVEAALGAPESIRAVATVLVAKP